MLDNSPKIIVFSVAFWRDAPVKLYNEWLKRVKSAIKYDRLFLAPGSYSDPTVMPDGTEVVQIGIKNTREYSRDWNYFRVGFQTALYHLLLNIKDFDVAIHVQDSVFLYEDLMPYVKEFLKRSEILAAPKFSSEMGCFIETGLMMLKKPAIEKYITSPLRPSLTEDESLNVEEEALLLFKDNWWNFAPEVLTIRTRDDTVTHIKGSPFDLSFDTLLNLPFFMITDDLSNEQINTWFEKNKV